MDDSHSPSFTPAPLTLTEDYYLNRINIAIFAITIAFFSMLSSLLYWCLPLLFFADLSAHAALSNDDNSLSTVTNNKSKYLLSFTVRQNPREAS